MSRSLDLFIRSAKPIEEVASDVSRLARLSLTEGELPGTWSLDQGDVHAELRTHPYIDDGELVLQRYQYALSARVSESRRTADSPAAQLLRTISESLRTGGFDTLLVHDLQYRDQPSAPAVEEPPAPAEAS